MVQNKEYGFWPYQNPCKFKFVDEDYKPNAFNAPTVTCQTYVIIDPKKTLILFSKNADEVREMASLTKIMTFIVSYQLSHELKIDIKTYYFKVSRNAARTNGTTGNLTENQRVTVSDLFYALMLPSGNDAAVCLAEGFSKLIKNTRLKPSVKTMEIFRA